MARIGYARVSTRSQNDDSQVDDLTAYGCDKIFADTASGKHAARPELDKALAYLRAGDSLPVSALCGLVSLRAVIGTGHDVEVAPPYTRCHKTADQYRWRCYTYLVATALGP